MTPYKKHYRDPQSGSQYSFVISPNDYYYYLNCYNDVWIFCRSGAPWKSTWTGQHSEEVSWLEILIVTGWSEEKVEQEARREYDATHNANH